MIAGPPLLVCLVPVRNGAADLPGYLASVGRFADAVVALDDGSTDDTLDLLRASPLVARVLTNPRRERYVGWDDGENRARLLAAAAELRPRWILSLDVDERLDGPDGEALRRFVATEAIPGLAFGFRILRLWGDESHVDPAGYWVYRLFAFEKGQRFPDQRLHFDPIPTSIPRSRWVRTTLRIQHLAGLTPERRRARVDKYRDVDPGRAFSYRYQDLHEDVPEPQTWESRSPDLPVILASADAPPDTEDGQAVVLSAIVISRDDEARIERAVAAVVGQQCAWPFEVIVVTSGTDGTADIVRRAFPDVTLVELPEPALPGGARNAGLRLARGEYVSFPGSHVELPQGSLQARIEAHDAGYAMVTGTTLNGTDTLSGWAAYLLDNSSVLPGRPSEVLGAAPAHCSYLRSALLTVGGFPEHLRAGEDTVVNQALAGRGYSAYRAQAVQLVHHNPCTTSWRLVRHYVRRGRSYGRILLDEHREHGRLLATRHPIALYDLQVRRRVDTVSRHVEAWGDPELRARYGRVRPLVALGATAHWAGTCFELARPRQGRIIRLVGAPVVTMALAGANRLSLVRTDAVVGRIKVVDLPVGDAPLDLEYDRMQLDALVGRSVDGCAAMQRTVRGSLWRAAMRRSSGLGARERVSLAWGLLRARPRDEHRLDVASRLQTVAEDTVEPARVQELVRRGLDTRDRDERVATVQTAPRARVLAP